MGTKAKAQTPAARPLELAIVDAGQAKRKFGWGEVVDGYKFYACHDAQLDILASTAKYTFAFAGSGGGKTCLIPLWLFKQLDRHRRRGTGEPWRALIVSPSLPTFESSQLKQHLIGVFGGTALEGEWKQQSKTYVFPGGEVVVKTAENDPKRLTGGQYDAIVLDECWAMTNPEIWEEVRRRSNIRNAPILGVTTPNVDGWLYAEVFQVWEAGDQDFFVRQWATDANPAKSPEDHAKFLEAERERLGEARFDRMYGGQFAALSGLVYPAFADPKAPGYPVMKAASKLPSPAVKAFGMIDWGYHPDPTAAYVAVLCEDDRIYVVEELYGTRIELDTLAVKLRDMKDRWSIRLDSRFANMVRGGDFDAFYCDTSRPEAASLMRLHGIPVRNKKVTEILSGVAMVDQLFRANRVRVFDTCVNLIREHRGYVWDGDRPKGGNDHGCDSLRYGLSSFMYGKPITPLPVTTVTAEDVEQEAVEAAVRLGHACEDPDEQRKREAKAEQEAYARWSDQMVYGDLDD